MEPILSSERVNTGRQRELDLARGLAVLFMVLIHVQEYFSLPEAKASLIGTAIDLGGGAPAAAVFMFLLGVGIVFTRNNDWRVFVRRGCMLILAGYLLNALRGTLPCLVKWHSEGVEADFYLGVSHFVLIDIFHFSGLTLIMFGGMKRFGLGVPAAFVLLFATSFANYLTFGHFFKNLSFAAVSGLFWGSSKITVFPFLTWVFYPLAGFIWGSLLIRCARKNLFHAANALLGAGVFAGLYLLFEKLRLQSPLSTDYAYYHHCLDANLLFTAFVLVWISILYFVSLALPERIFVHIERWSRNVSEIYFIHWLLVGWLFILIRERLSLVMYFVLFFLVFIVSDCLADYMTLRMKAAEAAANSAGDASAQKDGPATWKIAAGFLMVGLAIANLHVSCAGFIPFFADLEALQKNPAVFVYDENDRCAYPARVAAMAGIDRCLVEYEDKSLKTEVVPDVNILIGNLQAGTRVLVYEDDEKTVEGTVVRKVGEDYLVRIRGEKETIKAADMILPENSFLKKLFARMAP